MKNKVGGHIVNWWQLQKFLLSLKKGTSPLQYFFVSLEVSNSPIVDTRYLGFPVDLHMDYCLSMDMSLIALTLFNWNTIF